MTIFKQVTWWAMVIVIAFCAGFITCVAVEDVPVEKTSYNWQLDEATI